MMKGWYAECPVDVKQTDAGDALHVWLAPTNARNHGLSENAGISYLLRKLDAAGRAGRLGPRRHVDRVSKHAEASAHLAHDAGHHRTAVYA